MNPTEKNKPKVAYIVTVLMCLVTPLCALSAHAQSSKPDSSNASTSTSTPRKMTADEKAINTVLQEIFWRVKANDNSAFYESEFSYLREKMTLDEYLTGRRFQRIPKPNSDSIKIMTLDSAIVKADTARAYLTLTIRDDSGDPPRYKSGLQLLYRENGHWIKPLSTNFADNERYYRNVRKYEEDAALESDE